MKYVFLFLGFVVLNLSQLYSLPLKTDNLKTISISKMNFVYMEAQGTVEDFFEVERKTVLNHVLQYGVNTTRTAILFLDYFNSDVPYVKSYKDNEIDTANSLNSQGIDVSSNLMFKITQKYLDENFGSIYLKTKRKVLIGVLLFPSISITPTETIKVIKLDTMKSKGFQAILELSENDAAVSKYTKFDQIYDRTSIMKYMQAVQPYSYIGMMEVFDEDHQAYTYLAIQGDKKEFISEHSINPLLPEIKPTEEK